VILTEKQVATEPTEQAAIYESVEPTQPTKHKRIKSTRSLEGLD
jgi:hypothetical protein